MSDVETRLEATLGNLRADAATRAPRREAWDQIERRAAPRPPDRRVVMIGLGAATALLIVAVALLFPDQRESPDSGTSERALKLVYLSLRPASGTVTSIRLIARDLRTGREEILASGSPSCGPSPLAGASRGRIIFCTGDRTFMLDLATGRRTSLGHAPDGVIHTGWAPSGSPLFSRTGAKGRVYSYEEDRFRRVYTTEDFIYGGVVQMRDGILATGECSDEHCKERPFMLVTDTDSDDTLYRRRDASALVAFDDSQALLYQYRYDDTYRLAVLRFEGNRAVSDETGIEGTFDDALYGGAAVGPDGRIALVGGEKESWVNVLDPRGMKLRRIVAGGSPVAWTPDGERIAYTVGRGLRITDLRGRSRVVARGLGNWDIRVVTLVHR